SEAAKDVYADQLDIVQDFKESLKKEYMDIVTLERSASDGAFTGSSTRLTQAQEERAKALRAMLDAIEKEEETFNRQRYISLLNDYATDQEKRRKIIEKAEKDVADATEKGLINNIAVIQRQRDEDLTSLNATTVESLGGMQALLNQLEGMSSHAQRVGIKAAKATFEQWIKQAKLSEKEVEELRKVFAKLFRDADGKAA